MFYLSPSEKTVSRHHRQPPLLNPLTCAQIHGRRLAHLQMTLIQPSHPQASPQHQLTIHNTTRHAPDHLRRLDLPRRADPNQILLLRRLPRRMPRELDRGVVVVQRREPVLVLAQEREGEPELVHHARVRAQRRVPRAHQVREAVCAGCAESPLRGRAICEMRETHR